MDEVFIDFERLREDLLAMLEAAYFVGGFGAAMVDRMRVESCSDRELIEIALSYGFDLNKYSSQSNDKIR